MAKTKTNEHSNHYEKVKGYYEMYLESGRKRGWSKAMVKNAVVKGWITAEEYEEITDEPYQEGE